MIEDQVQSPAATKGNSPDRNFALTVKKLDSHETGNTTTMVFPKPQPPMPKIAFGKYVSVKDDIRKRKAERDLIMERRVKIDRLIQNRLKYS